MTVDSSGDRLGPDARRDRWLIYATAGVRGLAAGLVSVLLGLYLADLKVSAARVGFVMTAIMVGGSLSTFLVGMFADRFGRRRAPHC